MLKQVRNQRPKSNLSLSEKKHRGDTNFVVFLKKVFLAAIVQAVTLAVLEIAFQSKI